ncbi:MAG: TrkA family potassium uptake protein, partial [Anaerolineales bacterium]|nr:TrkA family potassium uptake protein [Anaerolineales bacterium]
MFVLVIGGGKTGSHLAGQLLEQGYQVKVIDDRPGVVERLQKELPAGTVFEGDGTSPFCLEQAGIRQVQVVAAVTGDDDENLVIATLARFEFNVPRVIARVNNPKNAWLFTREMGVDVALNQADLMARLIAEEMSLGDMMTLLKLRRGEYSIVEEKAHPDSAAIGKEIHELDLPEQCVLTAILRRGQLILPRGNTRIEAADEVIAVVHATAVAQLA